MKKKCRYINYLKKIKTKLKDISVNYKDNYIIKIFKKN